MELLKLRLQSDKKEPRTFSPWGKIAGQKRKRNCKRNWQQGGRKITDLTTGIKGEQSVKMEERAVDAKEHLQLPCDVYFRRNTSGLTSY